jgi:hypothetical protein
MPPKPARTRKPSASAVKKEVQEVYRAVTQELDEQREAAMKPEDKIAEKAQKAAIALADELTTDHVANEIAALKTEVAKTLSLIADKLDGEVARYHEIKKAVEAKEKELAEIYEIQKSASSLTALLEAQQVKRDEFEAESEARRQNLQEEVATARAAWDEEKKRHDVEIKERDTLEQRKRDREKEEYQYQFKREQQLAREKFEDEKARVERDIQTRKTQTEAALAEREKSVAVREQELADLRRKVEGAPKELDAAVGKAVKETSDRLQQEAKTREELIKREYEGERNVLLSRIESLEKAVKEQSVQVSKLSQQLEKAYSQVQDIAVKTVEGGASAKSLARIEQMVTDQAGKQAREK